MLKLWPKIRAKWDDATLSIFYGWRGCSVLGSGRDPAWTQRFTEMRKSYEELRFQPGVAEHEMVNHLRIAQEFMLASVWLYPTDFAETCCTNAIKARAAGCIPVTTHLAALDETAACSQGRLLPVSATDDEWLQAVAEVIDTSEDERGKMALEAIETYNLDSMLPAWGALLG